MREFQNVLRVPVHLGWCSVTGKLNISQSVNGGRKKSEICAEKVQNSRL